MTFLKPCQKYLFFLISLLAISCHPNTDVDVSGIDLDVKIERFDQELNAVQPQDFKKQLPALKRKYEPFYTDYFEHILQLGAIGDTADYHTLRDIVTSKPYKDLTAEVDSVFHDTRKIDEELTQAFKHVKYYFPQQRIPRIIGYVSGFQVQTPIGEGYIGVGLDMFLGAKSKFYPALIETYPLYISRRFTPKNIAPRVVEVLLREEMLPERDEDKNLLSRIIYNGKILYAMQSFIPESPDSLLIGYTDKQLEWVKTYEADTWGYFLEENLLYESDYNKIQKFLTDAPFTPGFGEHNDSAPKLGIWTGWQIVRKYMDNHPDISLKQLFQETDYQKILDGSKYRPK